MTLKSIMNKLRTHFFPIVLFCCFIATNATTPTKNQKIKQIEGSLYIIENNRAIKVNNHVITVRLKDSIELPKEIHKIRANKLGFIDIEVPDSIDIEEYVEKLKRTEKFETVEYNGIGKCLFSPNDTNISYQWHLNRINMPQAWELVTGNSNIKIAVIDTGIYAGHQDLGYGNQNYSHVDTLNSWDYIRNVAYMIPRYYHGTAVAGIIGAKTNNEVGIAGIVGGDACKGTTLLSLCIGESNDINDEVIGDAIIDAVDKGSKIINLSIATSETTEINEAIEYAYTNGVLVVCAAGNNSWHGVDFPASNNRTIAIGGTTQSNDRVYDSSYGTGLDFVAPGVNIYTATLGDTYSSFNGTSFAAPQVTGVIALMLAINPELTFEEIHKILRTTAHKLDYFNYDNNGWNNETGYGLIDAYAALRLTQLKMIASQCVINGNTVLCGPNTYSITSTPDTLRVTWNIDNPSFTITPSDTICVVTYNDTLQYDHATLTAVLSCNGDSLATLSKRIVAHGTNLVVEGWQDETITSNGTSPENQFIIPDGEEIGEPFPDDEFQEEIDGDLEAIPIDSIFTHNPHSHSSGNTTIQGTANIYGGTWLQLTSTRFDGMDINFSGSIAPELFYRVSPTELRLLMPYMENTYDVDLMASSPGGCHDFALRFNVNLLPGNVYGDEDLYIHFVGSHIGITLMCAEDIALENGQVQLPTWTLGIVNAQTGQWVHNATIQGQATSVNTANWANGVYIIRAGYNHNIYTKKFTITH